MRYWGGEKTVDIQFQQSEIGVAVVGLLLALLHHIVLENRSGLWVVSVEAIEDLLNVLRPVLCIIEGGAHGGMSAEEAWGGCRVEWRKLTACVVESPAVVLPNALA